MNIIISWVSGGSVSILVLITSTAIGLLPHLMKTRKGLCMSSIMLPVAIIMAQ